MILVVATYPSLLSSLHGQLTDLGCQMIVARTGAEAVEKAKRLRPQAILLHLTLPLVSGWDVMTLLQHDPETRDCPVIVLGDANQQRLAEQRGGPLFLSLPLSPSQLRSGLATVSPQLFTLVDFADDALDEPQPGDSSLQPVQPRVPSAPHQPIFDMTVLHLEPPAAEGTFPSMGAQIDEQLHLHGCRVISTENIEDAELLARIWKPKVVLHSSLDIANLQAIEPGSGLVKLPFVVLQPEGGEIAKQIPLLRVYSCSLFSNAEVSTIETDLAILIQVLKVAAGVD